MSKAGKNRNEGGGFAAFRGKWIEAALADPDLSDGAFRTLAGLAHHFLNREKRKIWAAQDTIAEKLGTKVRTLQYRLAELQGRGLLRIQRRGRDRPNWYFPAFSDPQSSADQEEIMSRKAVSDDPQISVVKTRKNLRPNLLKEPIEETSERALGPSGARAPDISAAIIIRSAPDLAPEGASGVPIAATIVDDDDVFSDRDHEDFCEWETPVEFIQNGVPDLPIRSTEEGWRRLLAWIGDTHGPAALKQAAAERRAGSLTIETILHFKRGVADVA